VIVGFMIVAVSFTSLLFFIIARQRQNKLYVQTKAVEELEKQLLKVQLEVQEATLGAIGKELHDNVGQLLSSSKMLLGVAARNPGGAEGPLKNADEMIGKAIVAIRSLSKMFDSEWLKQFSLIENLQTEIKRLNENNILAIHFNAPTSVTIRPEDQVILFRIIQEAIQNVLKHAEAKNIYLFIAHYRDLLLVTVADDGKGFDTKNVQTSGMGLKNIQARAKMINGEARWSSLDPGTELSIKIILQ